MKRQESRGSIVVPAMSIVPRRIIAMAARALLVPALLSGAPLHSASASAGTLGQQSPALATPAITIPSITTPAITRGDESGLEESTFSLTVRDAPLIHVLSVLSATTPLRFRYAVPPDAVVSANLINVPLLPTLEMLLRNVHWQMRRAGTDVFLFREEAAEAGAPNARGADAGRAGDRRHDISSWRSWNGTQPPPSNWTVTDTQPMKGENRAVWLSPDRASPGRTSSRQAGGGDPENGSPENGSPENGSPENGSPENNWQVAALAIDAQRRPGIGVLAPPVAMAPSGGGSSIAPGGDSGRTSAVAAGSGGSPLWMRWKVPLRFVPRRTTLLVETPVRATLYVNGAPLLRDWTGMRMIDLSRVLHHGDNYLAVFWPRVRRDVTAPITPSYFPRDAPASSPVASAPTSMATGTSPLTASSTDEPALRYEWFFDSTPGDIMESRSE